MAEWGIVTAWMDAMITVIMFYVLFRIGSYFYRRFLVAEVGQMSYVRDLFACTFALSISLYILLLSEIIGFLHPSSRRLVWQVDITVLLCMLILILPVSLAYTILVSQGYSVRRSSFISFACELVYLFLIYRVRDPILMNRDDLAISSIDVGTIHALVEPPRVRIVSAIRHHLADYLSYAHLMSGVLTIGTTLLAVISGFAAVNIPFDYITLFTQKVSATQVEAMEHRLSDSVQRVVRMKVASSLRATRKFDIGQVRINKKARDPPQSTTDISGSSDPSLSATDTARNGQYPSFASLEIPLENSLVQSNPLALAASKSRNLDLSETVAIVATGTAPSTTVISRYPNSSSQNSPVMTNQQGATQAPVPAIKMMPGVLRPGSALIPAPNEEELKYMLDELNVLFESYNELLELWVRQKKSKTFLGRILAAFGWFMLLACIFRVIGAIMSIIFIQRHSSSLTENVTHAFHRLSILAGAEIDISLWSQYASFVFASFLIVINIRGALVRVLNLFLFVSSASAATSLRHATSVLLAQLIGFYFLSSIVLIRALLPSGYRALIADAIGNVQFQFFKRWFDTIFVFSAALGGLILVKQVRGSRIRVKQNTSRWIFTSDNEKQSLD